jgi:hypothetical protein
MINGILPTGGVPRRHDFASISEEQGTAADEHTQCQPE